MALKAFTASGSIKSGGTRLYGFVLQQGTGAQTVNFRDGTTVGSPVLWTAQVAATSTFPWGFPRAIFFPNGLYVEVVGTGFTTGTIDYE